MRTDELLLSAFERELTARQDLESAAGDLVREIAVSGEHSTEDLARRWLSVLLKKAPVTCACIWADDQQSGKPRLVAPSDTTCPCSRSLESHVSRAFARKTSLRWPMSGANRRSGWRTAILEFVQSTPCSLAVLGVSNETQGADSTLQFAVSSVCTKLQACLAIADSAQRTGYRDMAMRVSQMASTNMLLAGQRVRHLLEREARKSSPPSDELQAILRDLAEAQNAFDDAQLLATPWQKVDPPLRIPVPELLREVAVDIGRAHGRKVIRFERTNGAEDCWAVAASELRLRYAFRSLFLLAWLLTNKTEPVHVVIQSDKKRVELRAGPCKALAKRDPLRLRAHLLSPDFYIHAADKFSVERGLGMQLAQHLISEVGGDIEVHLAGRSRRLVLSVSFSGNKSGAMR